MEMLSCVVTICNRKGLHARPAAKLVGIANQHQSDLWVTRLDNQGEESGQDEWRVNGRSILGLMMLGAASGAQLKFEATGDDAQALLDALALLVNHRFEESE